MTARRSRSTAGPTPCPREAGSQRIVTIPFSENSLPIGVVVPGFWEMPDEMKDTLAAGRFETHHPSGSDAGMITVDGRHLYPEGSARELTHGSFACVSFVDTQLEKLLIAAAEER